MHTESWREALWREVRLFPADLRWTGPGEGADPDYALMWNWYSRGPNAPYIPNLMPLELHYRLASELGQQVLAGLSAAEAGAAARSLSQNWVGADTERTALYREWAADVASA
jgi:hypothetical protein